MIREIIKHPNPVLRKRCREIKKIDQEIKLLAQEMLETLAKSQGLGLAGPQIGELKRIIAVQAETGPQAFINPKIVKKSRQFETENEGCLSFPGLFLEIKRAREVEVEALSLEGRKIRLRARGLLARIFQHEIDHLNGVLLIKRISFWQRLKSRKNLKQNAFN